MHPKHGKRKRSRLAEIIREWPKDDVLGSYTGTPKGGGEPTQDVDDL